MGDDNAPRLKVGFTPDDIRQVTFPQTRGHGLGLEESKVRAFQDQVAQTLESVLRQLDERDKQIAELRGRILEPDNTARVQQAVDILTRAQRTADTVIAEAHAYSKQVTAEANAGYDDMRRRAVEMVEEAERSAASTAQSVAAQRDEAQREAIYWHTYRESLISQLQLFIGALNDHVATAERLARSEVIAGPVPPAPHIASEISTTGASS